MLKSQLIMLLAIGVLVLTGCQTKTKTTEVVTAEKPCCTAEVKTCCSKTLSEAKATQVIYFHNERRCATCMAVEEVAQEIVALFDSTQISFNSYEIGNEATAQLEKELEISGQTLLIMGKDTTIDLTNSAFMNARVNPDKFKDELKSALESI